MSNYYLDLIEDASGDLVDIIYYHRFCASDELKAKGGWPCPEWPDYDVHCGGCGDLIHEGLEADGQVPCAVHGWDYAGGRSESCVYCSTDA